MQKFNLLGSPERIERDVSIRLKNKSENIITALKFDHEYFDGTREQGYGGYHYDGRWVPVAKKIVERYGLSAGSQFLDVGCAKGFLLQDLHDLNPLIQISGLDISSYAKSQARTDIGSCIDIGNCKSLPYKDNSFDAAVAINVLHNLEFNELKKSISELNRVVRNEKNIFIQLDAYTNEEELDLFETWVLTAKTYMDTGAWLEFLRETGFKGDYFWTVIGFDRK